MGSHPGPRTAIGYGWDGQASTSVCRRLQPLGTLTVTAVYVTLAAKCSVTHGCDVAFLIVAAV